MAETLRFNRQGLNRGDGATFWKASPPPAAEPWLHPHAKGWEGLPCPHRDPTTTTTTPAPVLPAHRTSSSQFTTSAVLGRMC